MYYYLFEPDGSGRERQHSRVVNLIHWHGISGEMATPGPGRPLEELITRAAEKGYNTIVAVGGDKFIAQVASYLTKSDIAFGVIPVGVSEKMQGLLGVKTLDQAILSLKQRKLSEVGVGVIAPGHIFLIEAVIKTSKPSHVIVESKTFRADGTFTQLTIERRDMVTVRFRDRSKGPGQIRRFLHWLFGKYVADTTETVLRAPIITVTTPERLPLLVNGEKIAETPVKVRVVPGVLKLIQARSTIG